jgi:hypothetical protein
MLKRRVVFILLSLAAVGWLDSHGTRAAALPALVTLAPGTNLRIQQTVDVNVVLIGFGGLVSPATLLAQSPVPAWNGVPQADGNGQTFIGQRFDFRYHVTMAPGWFEDTLFGFLRQVATPQPPVPIIDGVPPLPITPYQAVYNFCNVDPAFDPSLG